MKIEKEKATEDQFQKDTEQAIQLSEEEQAAKTENEKMRIQATNELMNKVISEDHVILDDDSLDEESLKEKNRKLEEEIAALKKRSSSHMNSTIRSLDDNISQEEKLAELFTKIINKTGDEKRESFKIPVTQLPTFNGDRFGYTDSKTISSRSSKSSLKVKNTNCYVNP